MPDLTYASVSGLRLPLYTCNTLVVGSGAASLNCAVHLYDFGVRDILIATCQMGGGASNLSGSDKQTYYKLSLAGSQQDSLYDMAHALFDGGAMHGDIALVEAALSALEFAHLIHIGVPFPHDRYGSYAGYKTDHDPRRRATSAGPRTSALMVECLARQVHARGVPILDAHEIVALLTAELKGEATVVGAVAVDRRRQDTQSFGLVLFNCRNVVFGTGGPGGLYRDSVYPEGQLGSIGVALEAGAVAQNLTESQFGLASTQYKWNVSGSYQQVIPRYISTGPDGSDDQEFLQRWYPTEARLATSIFLKGYQWPFDARRATDWGSSLIDLFVHAEHKLHGRRVFLDFRRNPTGFRFSDLEPEARKFLETSGAVQDTPIERLLTINPSAVEHYLAHGIDLACDPLEIAVCAQHCNGGLRVNIWWESNLRHLFPVGEVCGTHGVYRPGGAALNSGQVGGYRAAQYIAHRCTQKPRSPEEFTQLAEHQLSELIRLCGRITMHASTGTRTPDDVQAEIRDRMTRAAAHVRDPAVVGTELRESHALWQGLDAFMRVRDRTQLLSALQTRSLCLAHVAYLTSIHEYIQRGGGSRGSYLVLDQNGVLPCPGLELFRFRPEDPQLRNEICEIWMQSDRAFRTRWVPVRPIPEQDLWFENVWQAFRRKAIFG
ncbi:MAG: FAD-binding protein [Armatimonadota bacterium]